MVIDWLRQMIVETGMPRLLAVLFATPTGLGDQDNILKPLD
jgi:hypothetical protein